MDTVTVRARVPLPELARGQVGALPRTRRVEGLLASRRLVEVGAEDGPVPEGTVDEVLVWVAAGDQVQRAWLAERAERARSRPRSTLLAALEAQRGDESAGAAPEG